jgi:predicted Zn-ribbon and HTH transcriptional regulator
MKIIKAKKLICGSKEEDKLEERIENVQFNVIKYNNRPKPNDIRNIVIISCFAEFGCETLAVMYCVPQIVHEHLGKYKIIMGWHGREYFYRHLADEFWELKEEHQHLREYCRAFHHASLNLAKIEERAKEYGVVIPSETMGYLALTYQCRKCKSLWGFKEENNKECPKCKSSEIRIPLFNNISYWKDRAVHLPNPSEEKMREAAKHLPENPVGIFARGRKCYGRNLQPEFYVKLIKLLENKGYNPVWLGEKATTQVCPVDYIWDQSRDDKSKDLELTLAIIKQLKFTVQFWTASTRLAGMMGTPYLLFESPDQIWGRGQEGYRRNLCDFGHRKLAINHFLNVYENNDAGLRVVERCIEEMEAGNWEDVVGLVESVDVVRALKNDNEQRIGGINGYS